MRQSSSTVSSVRRFQMGCRASETLVVGHPLLVYLSMRLRVGSFLVAALRFPTVTGKASICQMLKTSTSGKSPSLGDRMADDPRAIVVVGSRDNPSALAWAAVFLYSIL